MASSTSPAYGKRLLPTTVDEHAASTPGKLFAAIPRTSNLEDGFRDVSFGDLARGVNALARWIEDRFGRSDTFGTLSYVGIPDLRGVLVWFAAIKCGYKLLDLSPRNPPRANASLMEQTGSRIMLHAAEIAPLVKPLASLLPDARLVPIPAFDDLLQGSPPVYPFNKSFEQARDDPILILHSSGSTGLPKPITATHGSFAVLDNEKNLPEPPGRRKQDWSYWNSRGEGARIYSVFPFFHFGGIATQVLMPIFESVSPVLGPPHLPPDASLVRQILAHQPLAGLILVPAIIEQLVGAADGMDLIRRAGGVLSFGGAPLSTATAGRLVRAGVELTSMYGSTETFPLPELMTGPEDWEYHEFQPVLRHEMRAYDAGEGTYELVLFADESNQDTSALYHNLSGVTEYHTKDLFTRHPDPAKPNLYKFYGRRDDIIVLANGEKFNPTPLEMSLQKQPLLSGAFVVGNGRNQAALLVEPSQPLGGEADEQKLREELWPFVQEANALVPGQGRILDKGRILIASRAKPLARSSKNTVIRRLSEEAYKEEIERLYSEAASPARSGLVVTLQAKRTFERSAVVDFVRSILAASFPPAGAVPPADDLFAHGLDSIQTLEIVANLKSNLKSQTKASVAWITPRTLFQHATVNDLANVLHAFLNEGKIPTSDSRQARARAVDEAVERYTQDLPKPSGSPAQAPGPTSVAVLGSTGYVGAYLVAMLLRNPDVEKIFCLDRSASAQTRLERALLAHDETLKAALPTKLVFMTVSLGQPHLGLADTDYQTLCTRAHVIVYNAWRLDFGHALRSFAPFLHGARELVAMSCASPRRPRIVFVSSLSAVGRIAAPEAAVLDPTSALDVGYGQAKLAAERILFAASTECGIPVSVVRLGQIGGPVNEAGRWDDQPWISGLMKTSMTLGYAPEGVGRLDWAPVDCVAQAIHDVAVQGSGEVTEAQFFNAVPSRVEPWSVLLDILRERYGVTKVVPLLEWCRRLRAVESPSAQEVERMPALKMLDFYEETARVDAREVACETGSIGKVSKVEIPYVSKKMIESWLDSWDMDGH
ncbi:hypothetical protein F4780DRAFT_775883 [Xylariomycetidae sp. FL0641]|nr:hypothetical protein F4780DRAFT_775883 [Xylariomycetidae sp. FL0641]